jgi:hypothetical protein
MRAATSLSLNLMWVVSTENGEPYFLISSSRIVPEPKQETYSAVRLAQGADRADAVGGVPHRGQAGPVIGPAVHVLLVARLEELELAEGALVVEFLHVQELPGVHHGLHHHVLQPGLLLEFDDLLAVGEIGRGHGHGAGDVLAGLQPSMDIQAWSGMGELMWTASTFGSLSRSVKSV